MNSHEKQSGSAWRWIMTLLCLAGLSFSAYLSWHYLAGMSVIGCGEGSSCDLVLKSKWSTLRGVLPVSGLAAGAYLAMFMAVFFTGPSTETPVRRLAWSALLLLAGSALGGAVWFTIVQKWLLKAFCPWCMATHAVGLLLSLVVFSLAPRQVEADSGAPRRLMSVWAVLTIALAGMGLSGILAAGQAGYSPAPVVRVGEIKNTPKPVDLHSVPVIGSPDAQLVVTLFYDHKCPHCQKVHAMLDEVVERYDGKIAFALRPAPLCRQCNPHVMRDGPEYRESCELAKMSLAIWLADPGAFHAFDNWWFTPEPEQIWRPRSVASAKTKAVELLGQAKYDAAIVDARVDVLLEKSIEVFGETVDHTGVSVPRLALGARWVSAESDTVEDLIAVLQNTLGVPRP